MHIAKDFRQQNTMDSFQLTPLVRNLVEARNALRSHYRGIARQRGCPVDLDFTLDGNLVGDIGEALAVELFGILLDPSRSSEGIDGTAPDGRTVQVKATGRGRGPAFRRTRIEASHLIFLDIDFENAVGTIAYNGPLCHVAAYLPETFIGQRAVSMSQVRRADALVRPDQRLARLG